MKIYRPSHILFGIIFFVGSYFAYSIYNVSTIFLGILIFIGIANIIYAFSDPKNDLPESKHPYGKIFYEASKQFLKDSKGASVQESFKIQFLIMGFFNFIKINLLDIKFNKMKTLLSYCQRDQYS